MSIGAFNWLYNLMMCGIGLFAVYLGLVAYLYLRGLHQNERRQNLLKALERWWKELNREPANGRAITAPHCPSELLSREALQWSQTVVFKQNFWAMLQTHLESLQNAILDILCAREMQVYQKIRQSMTLLGMAGTVIGMCLAFQKLGAAGPKAFQDVLQSMSLAFLSTLNGLAWAILLHFGEGAIFNQRYALTAQLSSVPGEIIGHLAKRFFLKNNTQGGARSNLSHQGMNPHENQSVDQR